jgi:ABC-type multidrug transport system permease subunit
MSDRARLRAFLALCLARLREYYREPEVLFWGFLFPLLLSFSLAVAFRDRAAEPSRALVQEGAAAERVLAALRDAPLVRAQAATAEEAARALRMGRADVVVLAPAGPGAAVEYRFDPSRPESGIARARVDEALQRAAGRLDPVASRDVATSEPGGRYVDFLVPGLVGMNLMSAGMWGVGFALVDMRIKKLLKRLLATPLRPADFMLALMTTRLVSTFLEVGVLLGFARLVLGVPVRGSLAAVLAIAVLGSMTFAGLGLAVGCRARRIETVSGLMNLVTMPMFVASGVFFSVERFPAAVQPFLQALPLTALNDALRAVMLDGASLAAVSDELLILTAWAAGSFALALRLFRWR